MNSVFEIEKTLVASSAHITREDMATMVTLFPELSGNCRLIEYEYGVIVHILEGFDLSELGGLGLSDGILSLLIFTVSNGCIKLKIDCDGPKYDGFKSYEW